MPTPLLTAQSCMYDLAVYSMESGARLPRFLNPDFTVHYLCDLDLEQTV